MSMEREDQPMLSGVAHAVADGTPIDWDGLKESKPEISEDLEALRVVESVAAAHRVAIEAAGAEDTSAATQAIAATPTSKSRVPLRWGRRPLLWIVIAVLAVVVAWMLRGR